VQLFESCSHRLMAAGRSLYVYVCASVCVCIAVSVLMAVGGSEALTDANDSF